MEEIVAILNGICGFKCIKYCKYSMAFFAYVPFEMAELAERIKQLLQDAGCKEVLMGEEAGGECLQVSGYV